MAWVSLDDKLRTHPKILAVGPLGAWQFVCSLGFSNEYLLDGYIPYAALSALVPNQDIRVTRRLASLLVSVGLWEVCDGGFRIHDYLKYQPSAAKVRAIREATRVRKEAWLERKRNGVPNGVTNALGTPLEHMPPTPTPTQEKPKSFKPNTGYVAERPSAARLEGAPPAPGPNLIASKRSRSAPREELQALTAHVLTVEPTLTHEAATLRAQFLLSAGVHPPQNPGQPMESI